MHCVLEVRSFLLENGEQVDVQLRANLLTVIIDWPMETQTRALQEEPRDPCWRSFVTSLGGSASSAKKLKLCLYHTTRLRFVKQLGDMETWSRPCSFAQLRSCSIRRSGALGLQFSHTEIRKMDSGIGSGEPERLEPRIRRAFEDCDVDAMGQIPLQ